MAAAGPSPSFTRATDEALLQGGSLKVRAAQPRSRPASPPGARDRPPLAARRLSELTPGLQRDTLAWSVILNVLILLAALLLYWLARQESGKRAAPSWLLFLYSPRALVAQMEAIEAEKAESEKVETGGPSRASQLRRLNRNRLEVTHQLPTLPSSGWLRVLYSIPDAQIIEFAGLDALAFLYFQQMCAWLFLGALAAPLLLCPLFWHFAGTLSLPARDAADRSHNAHHPLRLWLPLLVAAAVFGWLAFLLRRTQARLLRARLTAAQSALEGPAAARAAAAAAPEEFALLVTDIPSRSRSVEGVRTFFQSLLKDSLSHRPDAAAWPKVLLCPPTARVQPAWERWRTAAFDLSALRAAMRAGGGGAEAAARMQSEEARLVTLEREASTELASARSAARDGGSRAAVVLLPTRTSAASTRPCRTSNASP